MMSDTDNQAADKLGAPRWDIESVFPGGSNSEGFKSYRENLKRLLDDLERSFKNFTDKADQISKDELIGLILKLQDSYHKLELVHSFSGCLTAQNVSDDAAFRIFSEAQVYESRWENLQTILESFMLEMPDSTWNSLLKNQRVNRISFYLDELRQNAKLKMSPEKESLALDLSVDGYHAWNNIYTKMAGNAKVEFTEDGQTLELSLGQLALRMASPNRDIRKQAFEKLTEAWQKSADLSSMMLNSQAGFRLSLYKNRGWKSALFEPLQIGRLKEETLNTMWKAVQDAAPGFQKFVDAKKKLLGIDKFCWYDQTAPAGESSKLFKYDEASDFIVEQLGGFSKELSEFAAMALKNNWIEAQDRAGKAAGGFCTGLGEVKESRIFMTYGGSFDHLLTLAHELGHAYHHHVLRDEPAFATFYPMGLAETASTFNELLVTDAALKAATDAQEKIMLLDQKLMNGLTMFCNIHCRFIFDRNFYIEREKGVVSKERLNELMTDAQEKAFCGMLDPDEGYHPEFWASKLHFFETRPPFYNFPYTFGFLFSNAVYSRAMEEGASFARKYRDFLSDTGSMTSEEVAKKHLDFDLTDPKFWEWVTSKVTADIDPFVELVK